MKEPEAEDWRIRHLFGAERYWGKNFGSNIMWMRHRLVFASRSVDNQERFQWATLEVKLKWRCIFLSLLKVSGSSLLNFHRNRAAGIVIGAWSFSQLWDMAVHFAQPWHFHRCWNSPWLRELQSAKTAICSFLTTVAPTVASGEAIVPHIIPGGKYTVLQFHKSLDHSCCAAVPGEVV